MTLRWVRTWGPNTPDDYTAISPNGGAVGRVSLVSFMPGHGGRWIWNFLVHNGREAAGTTTGRAETKQEAADAVRAAWERAHAWSAETGKPLVFGRQPWVDGEWRGP